MVEVVDYLGSVQDPSASVIKPGNQVSERNQALEAQRLLLSGDRGSLSFQRKPSPVYSNSERVQFGDTSFCGHLCLSLISKLLLITFGKF